MRKLLPHLMLLAVLLVVTVADTTNPTTTKRTTTRTTRTTRTTVTRTTQPPFPITERPSPDVTEFTTVNRSAGTRDININVKVASHQALVTIGENETINNPNETVKIYIDSIEELKFADDDGKQILLPIDVPRSYFASTQNQNFEYEQLPVKEREKWYNFTSHHREGKVERKRFSKALLKRINGVTQRVALIKVEVAVFQEDYTIRYSGQPTDVEAGTVLVNILVIHTFCNQTIASCGAQGVALDVRAVVQKGNNCIYEAEARSGESAPTYMLGGTTALRLRKTKSFDGGFIEGYPTVALRDDKPMMVSRFDRRVEPSTDLIIDYHLGGLQPTEKKFCPSNGLDFKKLDISDTKEKNRRNNGNRVEHMYNLAAYLGAMLIVSFLI